MNDSQPLFLELLKIGLWGTPADLALFRKSPIDWKTIFDYSKYHAVASLIYDGVMSLPADLRPEKATLRQLGILIIMVEERNKYHNHQIVEITRLLKDVDLDPILLKGQGLAKYYLNSEHRQYGDIDLFVEEQYIDRAVKALADSGHRPFIEKSSKDICFTINGILLEVHFNSIILSYPRNMRIWNDFQNKYLLASNFHIDIDGSKVRVPSPDFNALYIFLHSLKHLLTSEVSMKQLSDLSMVLYKTADQYDKTLILDTIREMKMNKAFYTFIDILVNYLGFPSDLFPIPDKYRGKSDRVFHSILNIIPKAKTPKGYLSKRVNVSYKAVVRNLRFASLYPSETFFYPFWIIGRLPHHLGVYLKKKF